MIALLFVLLAQVYSGPTDAASWFREGVRLHDAHDYKGALAAYEHAAAMNYPQRGQLSLRRARALAQTGDKENALAALEQLASGGFPGIEQLLGENELLPVRADDRWPKIVEKVRANAHPCRAAAEFRQFDFWLGEWDVEIAGGGPPATSSIQLILDQCVVFENYTAGNYTGKSFSSWVPAAKEWKQHYVDSTGNNSEWSGKLDEGRMVFLSRSGGLQRMTYSKEGPDRVRQLIETSADDGKTWSTSFDGMYVRRK